jgi:hypothetical protein
MTQVNANEDQTTQPARVAQPICARTEVGMVEDRSVLLRGAGICAPLVYVGAVILGGADQAGYSHLVEPVSALTASGELWLNGLFGLYNLLLLGFSALIIAGPGNGNAAFRTAGWLMALLGVIGLGLLVFPMDLPGSSTTLFGAIHLGLAAVASIGSMAVMAAAALGWQRARARSAAMVSWAALSFVLVTGGLTVFAAATAWPLVGALERLTIGGFLAWILWSAVVWRGPASRHPDGHPP